MKKRASQAPAAAQPEEAAGLRVEMARSAQAALLAHAAEFPDVEVCGVLVGSLPAEGAKDRILAVEGIVRGEGARERGAAVTFTNETWNHIHDELDKRWPGRRIVGWYHTHPDFDVFLSDMDTFIHTNFFGHPDQVALVRDPVRGATAIFARKGDGLVPLERYWLDGNPVDLAARTEPGGPGLEEELRDLRRMLAEVQATLEDQDRGNAASWAIAGLLAVLVAILGTQFYYGWRSARRSEEALRRLQGLQTVVPPEAAPQPAAPKDKP